MDNNIQLIINEKHPYFVKVVGLPKCDCILTVLEVDSTIKQRFTIGIQNKAKEAVVIIDKKFELSKSKKQYSIMFNPTEIKKDVYLEFDLHSDNFYIQSYVIMDDYRGVASTYTGLVFQSVTIQEVTKNSFTIGLHNSKSNDNYSVLIKIELLNFKEDIMIKESCISLTY